MLAYRKPGEPIQTAFPARYHTPELSALLRNVTELYVPETVVGVTGACCSDHQVRTESCLFRWFLVLTERSSLG